MSLAQEIKTKALQLGFDAVGITDASPLDGRCAHILMDWLASGFAASMQYMHRNIGRRLDPSRLLDGARSVVVVALNYKVEATPVPAQPGPLGEVALFGQYEDYHRFIKTRLFQLAEFAASLAAGQCRFKVCVDSAPVAERALAARAGLGFIGKNRILTHPTLGPAVLLGEIITTLELETDTPVEGSCSGCNQCVEACPTGALRKDGGFDGGRCISYLTVEHRDQIPSALATGMGSHLFGCDRCMVACPHYQKAPAHRNADFKHYPDRAGLNLLDLLGMGEEAFCGRFGDSPLLRPGLEGLKRNARICLENSVV